MSNFNARNPILATLALATAFTPLAARADVPGVPQLKGRVTAFDGKFDLHVETKGGDVQDVVLHRGTIINPTGLTLRPGMRVTILGQRRDGRIDADEIDTPYHVSYERPGFGYGGFYGPGFGPGSYGPGFGPGFYGPVYGPGLYNSGFYGPGFSRGARSGVGF